MSFDILLENFFRAPLVAIDDQIDDASDRISGFIERLRGKNVPVVTYKRIPDPDIIRSFFSVSFIILDWRYADLDYDFGDIDEDIEVELPNVDRTRQKQVIDFIKKIQLDTFVPIIMITQEGISEIKDIMLEHSMNQSQIESIFFYDKSNLDDIELFAVELNGWFKLNPAAYLLRKWDIMAGETKNIMFRELSSKSSDWASFIRMVFRNDRGDIDGDCTEFLNNQFVNRFKELVLDDDYFADVTSIKENEIREIIQTTRFIRKKTNEEYRFCRTGDLFKDKKGRYWLNIRAQCDVTRKRNNKIELYLISGKAFSESIVASNLDSYGNIKEKVYEAYTKYIDDKYAIGFDLRDLKVVDKEEAIGENCEYIFVGRLLKPDITRIQQKFASYIIREGLMPLPNLTDYSVKTATEALDR